VTRPSHLVDTAVFAYALGGEHPLREPCRAVVAAAGSGRLDLHASVELVQELVFHRMRKIDRTAAVRQARDAATLCTLHDFDRAVLERALQLIDTAAQIGGRDAVHAATALQHGLGTIISPDPAFDQVDGLTRLPPDAALSATG
jgi:predicted nucleic acid-binding protein